MSFLPDRSGAWLSRGLRASLERCATGLVPWQMRMHSTETQSHQWLQFVLPALACNFVLSLPLSEHDQIYRQQLLLDLSPQPEVHLHPVPINAPSPTWRLTADLNRVHPEHQAHLTAEIQRSGLAELGVPDHIGVGSTGASGEDTAALPPFWLPQPHEAMAVEATGHPSAADYHRCPLMRRRQLGD
jgi:hypothetical protein